MATKHRITTCLWFDGQAEDAANYYVSIFKNSKVTNVMRNTRGSLAGQEGSVLTVDFELDGMPIMGLNGGPMFKFSEAISMVVHCETQEEVDYYWDALTANGGTPSHCGWLKDKFGVSWQIVPQSLIELLQDPDTVKSGRVMQAMLTMGKIDIAAIKGAHAGQ